MSIASITTLIDRAQDAHDAALLRRGVSAVEIAAASEADRGRLGRVRGFANEKRVMDALAAAPLPNWIVRVRSGGPSEDRGGIDVVVLCDDHRRYRIQVKSSAAAAKHFRRLGRRRGRTSPIGIVIVTDRISDRELVDRVLVVLTAMRARRAGEAGR